MLHFVDVESENCLDEIFGIDVHGQHAVVLTAHDYGTLRAVELGVEVQVAAEFAEQPTREIVIDAEFLGAERSPTHKLVFLDDFGNYGDLAERETQVAVD